MRISFVSALRLDIDMHKTRELEMAKALAERGHTITLVATISKRHFQVPDSRIHLIPIPIRCVPLISPLIWAGVLLFFLPIHVLASRPDFIIMDPEISVLSSIPTLIASRLSKVKFILDVRSTPVEVLDFPDRLEEFLFNVSVLVAKKLFAGIVAVTSEMKSQVCRKFDIDQRAAGVWSNGAPTDLFNPQNSLIDSVKLREKFALTNKFVVFYHGIFSPHRALTETVEAIHILRQKHPEVVFFLLGSGPSISRIEDAIQQKGLQINIIVHGPVPYEDVPKFIGLCDVGIVPAPDIPDWRFQSPLKLMEYLAMGKVAIVSDIPACREIVDDENCGIYLQSCAPFEIAKSIEYAYVNKDRLDGWGKVGRRIIQENYTWEKVGERVEHYLLSIDLRPQKRSALKATI
jgi:glycosyltransferase involved in cell wall biosynthesis